MVYGRAEAIGWLINRLGVNIEIIRSTFYKYVCMFLEGVLFLHVYRQYRDEISEIISEMQQLEPGTFWFIAGILTLKLWDCPSWELF